MHFLVLLVIFCSNFAVAMENIHCNRPNEELSEAEWRMIEERMQPSSFCTLGFIGPDEKLSEVIEADRIFLEQSRITYKQIVDRLNTLIGKYYSTAMHNPNSPLFSLGIALTIEEKFIVSISSCNGAQTCPFKNDQLDPHYHGFSYGSSDVYIKNIASGREIKIGTLLLHLILAHKFFEGPKCPYRVNPKDLIEILELKEGVDYAPKYKRGYWLRESHSYMNEELRQGMLSVIDNLKNMACKYYKLEHDVHAFLFPTNKFLLNDPNFLISPSSDEKWQKIIENYESTGSLEGMSLQIFAPHAEENMAMVIEQVKKWPGMEKSSDNEIEAFIKCFMPDAGFNCQMNDINGAPIRIGFPIALYKFKDVSYVPLDD